ncbi:hypothetical protein, partial [Staphylococcus aureus]|uniref:hypothetical protein n=1 Tax=Staphylococcus aureus TaxID=1280 RepID=UPI001C83281B
LKADLLASFCVGALTPTFTLLKADYWPASMLARQLALSVEFLFEILYVGPRAHFRSVNYCQY